MSKTGKKLAEKVVSQPAEEDEEEDGEWDELEDPEERAERLEKARLEKEEALALEKAQKEAALYLPPEEVAPEDKNDPFSEELKDWGFDEGEQWHERDLGEVWANPPVEGSQLPGQDLETLIQELAEGEDDAQVRKRKEQELKEGYRYKPYRKPLPPIPEPNTLIQGPLGVLEELEREEEFLDWSSYVFRDGSTYEGTTWDDLAHGKGVYTTQLELCRYEGEWSQNMMEGHGVLEVNIPVPAAQPDTEEAKKAQAAGDILEEDFWDEEDKEWLKMALEDDEEIASKRKDKGEGEIPIEDREEWQKFYGRMPDKGFYKYAGQWKHSRMHGCGVFEVNGKAVWGRFYFGDLQEDPGECDEEACAFHSSMAAVAAAKSRMFVNKPDGMVREMKGPYTDPTHPYMYEAGDEWMAPGFTNQFYEVPEMWKDYVVEVDKEREMWLNSFIKSPFRIPMPPELEYLWDQEDEFVVLDAPPEMEKEKGAQVLLHMKTGQIINWATDKNGQLRFFIQPLTKDGKADINKIVPLPLGFNEFMGMELSEEEKASRPLTEWEKRQEAERNKPLNILMTQKKNLEKKWKEEMERLKREWEEEDEFRREDQELKMDEARLKVEMIDEELRLKEESIRRAMERKKLGLPEEEIEEEEETEEFEEDDEKDVVVEEKVEDKKKVVAGKAFEKKGGSAAKSKKVEDDDDSEDDDDDEDGGGKPRSFGKFAMAGPRGQQGGSGSPPFPTALASMTLGSQVAVSRLGFHVALHAATAVSLLRGCVSECLRGHAMVSPVKPLTRVSKASRLISATQSIRVPSLGVSAKPQGVRVAASLGLRSIYTQSRSNGRPSSLKLVGKRRPALTSQDAMFKARASSSPAVKWAVLSFDKAHRKGAVLGESEEQSAVAHVEQGSVVRAQAKRASWIKQRKSRVSLALNRSWERPLHECLSLALPI